MYKVDKQYNDCTVYVKDKQYNLGDATQKQLKDLFIRGHKGITFEPKKIDKGEGE